MKKKLKPLLTLSQVSHFSKRAKRPARVRLCETIEQVKASPVAVAPGAPPVSRGYDPDKLSMQIFVGEQRRRQRRAHVTTLRFLAWRERSLNSTRADDTETE